jgi:acyl carrier protein
MPTESEIRQQLRTFICTELMQYSSYPLLNDEPLISGGLIDSFCIAELAVFIEQAYDLYIPDTELTVEGMDTLNLIVARVLQG